MRGHGSHCDSKIEAARHCKVDLDCYSCHQSARRLGALKAASLTREFGGAYAKARCSGGRSPFSEALVRIGMTSFMGSLAR
jgi:hypothetical protein